MNDKVKLFLAKYLLVLIYSSLFMFSHIYFYFKHDLFLTKWVTDTIMGEILFIRADFKVNGLIFLEQTLLPLIVIIVFVYILFLIYYNMFHKMVFKKLYLKLKDGNIVLIGRYYFNIERDNKIIEASGFDSGAYLEMDRMESLSLSLAYINIYKFNSYSFISDINKYTNM